MIGSEHYKFFDVVFLRAPYYGFEHYHVNNMETILQDPVFRNAIWLSSPGFYRELEKKAFNIFLLNERARLTLLKYYNRMSFRATPFGAFASYSLASWKEGGIIRLGAGRDAKLRVLPALAFKRVLECSAKPESIDGLVAVNPGAYVFGDTWRFIRGEADLSGRHRFAIHAIERGPVNDYIIRMAGDKPCKRSLLIRGILEHADCSEAEAATYVSQLVSEQLLLTSDRSCLLENPGNDPYKGPFVCLKSPGIQLTEQGSLAAFAERISRETSLPESAQTEQLFYTALERPVLSGGADPGWQAKILEAMDALQKLSLPAVSTDLAAFREAFRSKFEARKVPLMTALDPDAGISFAGLHQQAAAMGLLEDVRYPGDENAGRSLDWGPVHRLFLRKWFEDGSRAGYEPVVLDKADLDGLSETAKMILPPTTAVMFRETGEGLLIDSAGGITGTALTGRFSAFSEDVHHLCRLVAKAETAANPGVLFAEIHQLSHDHVDNINRRRQIYDHVIQVNTFPSPDAMGNILPADLLLFVAGDEIILESVSLGKRIIPRLPTAFNFRHSEHALFRLLCELQYQGFDRNLDFDPARLFPGLSFYPRVVFKQVILSPAKWIIDGESVKSLTARPRSIGRLHLLRQAKGIPHRVALGSGDQQLVFDFANDEEVLFFLDVLKPGEITLTEFLPPRAGIVCGKQVLAGQYIALLQHGQEIYAGLPETYRTPKETIVRSFLPGSDWLYLKIYCTPESADQLLLDLVFPVIKKHQKHIRCWFFIRYHDPEQHLRIRIRMPAARAQRLIAGFNHLVSRPGYRDLVRQIGYEPYHRELERYGEVMDRVEDLFYHGSDWTIRLLIRGRQGGTVPLPELEPLVLVYRWCCAFIPDLNRRIGFIAGLKDHYLQESGTGIRIDLDLKYRGIARELRQQLAREAEMDHLDANDMMEKLLTLRKVTESWPEWRQEKLLADLVHMQVNRIYPVAQRRYEGVIYYCLYKYMVSLRSKNTKPTSPFPGN